MWLRGRRALAVALQSRMSEMFDVDIHPAATLGWGLMMDHATGAAAGRMWWCGALWCGGLLWCGRSGGVEGVQGGTRKPLAGRW